MGSTPSSERDPLGEVLEEVETILGIRRKLGDRAAREYPFPPDWMDKLLVRKVQELSQAEEAPSTLKRLQYIDRMLDCQSTLIDKGLTGLADQLTLAVFSHKSKLEEQKDMAKAAGTGQVCPESPSGGRPEGWRLRACGTRDQHTRGGNLRLLWDNYSKTFKVWKGRPNTGNTILDLQIFPHDLEQFICSRTGSKVIIEHSFEDQANDSVYLHMEKPADVSSLYEFLIEISENVDFERQILSSKRINDLIKDLEQ
ncbi:MAG: hypothetical protein Q9169_002249 [Polycauliona sp. 2 TL-2023]